MSFHIRRLTSMARALPQQLRELCPVTIEPHKVILQKYCLTEVNIIRLIINNNQSELIQFKIKQPRSSALKVKTKSHTIEPNGTQQLFLFFNCYGQSKQIEDQFILKFTIQYSISVPIIIKPHLETEKENNFTIKEDQFKSSQKLGQRKLISKINSRKRLVTRVRSIKPIQFLGMQSQQKLEDLIDLFVNHYSSVVNYLGDKAIKNQVFIGQKQTTPKQKNEIISFNNFIEFIAKQKKQKQILARYQTVYSIQGPSMSTKTNYQLSWDLSRNNRKITYNKAMSKLHEEVRKIVVNYRFDKIYKYMSLYRKLNSQTNQKRQQSHIIKNTKNNQFVEQKLEQEQNLFNSKKLKESLKKYSPENNSESERQEQQLNEMIKQRKKHEYCLRKINRVVDNKSKQIIGEQFNFFSLSPRILKQDFSVSEQKIGNTFEIKPRVGFDNWVPIQELSPNIHEIMGYRKIQKLPEWECHPLTGFNVKINHTSKNEQQIQSSGCWINNKQPQLQDSQKTTIQPENNQMNKLFKEYFLKDSSMRTYYKNYDDTSNGLKDYQKQQDDEEQLINKSINDIICNQQNSSCLKLIKIYHQQFFPFFTGRDNSRYAYQFIEDNSPSLIHQISREDVINFDEALPKLIKITMDRLKGQKNCKHKNLHKKNSNDNCDLFRLQHARNHRPNQIQDSNIVHQRILQNMLKVKQKCLHISYNKVYSFNKLVRNGNFYFHL